MDKLDRFFRALYQRTPPPAAPPPGGWEQLQARLRQEDEDAVVLVPIHGGRRWLWLLLLLPVLTLGWYATLEGDRSTPDTYEAPQPRARTFDSPISSGAVVDRTTDTSTDTFLEGAKQVSGPAHPMSANGGGAETGKVLRKTDRDTTTPYVPVMLEAGRPALAPTVYPTKLASPETKSSGARLLVPELPRAVTPVAPRSRYAATDDAFRQAIAQLEPLPILPGAVAPNSLGGRRWRFTRTPRKEPTPGAWEVSGRTVPWIVEDWGGTYGQVYTTEANLNQGPDQLFILNDGSTERLYYTSTHLSDYRVARRLTLVVTGLEIARRTRSGFRFSLGGLYTGYPEGFSYDPESYRNLIAPDEYVLVNRYTTNRGWYLTLGLQYTINRRRRFRINLGLQAVGKLYEEYGREEYLVGGAPFGEHFVSRITNRSAGFLSELYPLPQLTLEYRLRRNLALSLGIGGMSGIGVSYQVN